jgi:hypothetical protein
MENIGGCKPTSTSVHVFGDRIILMRVFDHHAMKNNRNIHDIDYLFPIPIL